jgi:hypothetical protein
MDAAFSSETSVDLQRSPRLYIPEDSALHLKRLFNFPAVVQSTSACVGPIIQSTCNEESKNISTPINLSEFDAVL